MRKYRCEILCFSFCLAVFFCIPNVSAGQKQKSIYYASSLKKVGVEIEQYYDNCKPEEISLPVEALIKNLFRYADAEVVLSDAKDCDVILKIKITGNAEGIYYYPGGNLYTGVYLAGKLSLESQKFPVIDKKFETHIDNPSLTEITYRPIKPCQAPFSRAFYSSDSFVSKLFEIIQYMYGIDPLISALKDKNADVQNLAIKALADIGKPAVKNLIAALSNEDLGIKRGCIEALGKIGDNNALEPLMLTLKDEDTGIRLKAVKALGSLGDKRAVEPLIAALNDKNNIVKRKAAEMLGEIGDPRAIEPLLAVLKDKDTGVQYYAKESLAKIKGKYSERKLSKNEG
ncbi:MAG: HEAT repeat domain-containing protein [bacterium]|nr:HEAT repeat domain-containing protein [bacterium]